MRVELKLDPSLKEPHAVVYASARTPEMEALIRQLEAAGEAATFTAYRDNQVVLLPLQDILLFQTDGKGVVCQTERGTYTVKQRIYELEEGLKAARFVRVSNSELINLSRVTSLDLSITGTIRITLADGAATSYASRRYVKKLKEAVGL